MILDGIGVAPRSEGNAVTLAKPENLARLWEVYPRTYLDASGETVGLVENTNGNSEVGHLTIGSGKAHYQNLLKINNAIRKGVFFSNQTILNLLRHSKNNNSQIHLMGCLSDGAVHSHINHFIAVLEFLKRENFDGKVLIHAFTDGRDSPQKSAKKYLSLLDGKMKEYGIGKIATICGRAYAMDRNQIMHRTQRAARLLLKGTGEHSRDWEVAIDKAYNKGQTDEYINPTCIFEKTPEESIIKDNDAILFMNFRPDRAIQISKEITQSELKNIFFAGMAEYEKNYPENLVFPKEYLSLPLGRIISEAGSRQFRLAESEKFPHVTYFFNGGQPIQYPGEERETIPSPDVVTYDLKPEMSAYKILAKFKEIVQKGRKDFKFAVINIANCDMVGHTGNIDAAIKTVRIVDDVSMQMVKFAKAFGWTTIITADHGNIERMVEPMTQLPNTEHTQNPVPLLIIDDEIKRKNPVQLRLGNLTDIAPTILKLMDVEKPSNITGRSLI